VKDPAGLSLLATLGPDEVAGLAYEWLPASEPIHGPSPLLLLLHGSGSNEHDLLGLAPYLDGRCMMASVRAPFPGGAGAYAWYRTSHTAAGPMIDEEQEAASRRNLAAFADHLAHSRGALASGIFLLGFSQGATMALSLLLDDPQRYAGALVFGARLLPGASSAARDHVALGGKPVFAAHGLLDDVVPVARARAMRSRLLDAGLDLDYREYASGHDIPGAALRDAAAWLGDRLERIPGLAPRVLQS
jgi:phospholipase/carboxylesterase